MSLPDMKKLRLFLLFLVPFVSVLVVNAQEADDSVTVENIKFDNNAGNDWVAINVEVKAKPGANTTGTSRNNSQYTDNVKVRLLIAYMRGGNTETIDYFTSEVELITMEKSKKYTIPFYMCGPVIKRERYNKEPYAYCVQIEVGGRVLTPTQKNVSSSLSTPERLQNFISKTMSESSKTDGTLIPVYDVPTGSFMKEAPAYRIRSKK